MDRLYWVTARNEAGRSRSRRDWRLSIHPYDDDRIIAGQATASKELSRHGDLDAVFAPVSGGGLCRAPASAQRSGAPIFAFLVANRSAPTTPIAPSATGILQSGLQRHYRRRLRASLVPRTFAISAKTLSMDSLPSEREIIPPHAVVERMKSSSSLSAVAIAHCYARRGRRLNLLRAPMPRA